MIDLYKTYFDVSFGLQNFLQGKIRDYPMKVSASISERQDPFSQQGLFQYW